MFQAQDKIRANFVDLLGEFLLPDNLSILSQTARVFRPNLHNLWREQVQKFFPEEYAKLSSDTNWQHHFILLCQDKFHEYTPHERKLYYHAWQGNANGVANIITPSDFKIEWSLYFFHKLLLTYAKNQQPVLNAIYKKLITWFKDGILHNGNSLPLLYWAIHCNQPIETIDQLITTGADINTCRAENKLNAFGHAIAAGNLEMVKHLQQVHNAELNGIYSNADTPLHVAARYNHFELVEYFLTLHPTDINVVNDSIATPLEALLQNTNNNSNYYPVYQLLCSRGALISDICIEWACRIPWKNGCREIIIDLLEHGMRFPHCYLNLALKTYEVEKIEFFISILKSQNNSWHPDSKFIIRRGRINDLILHIDSFGTRQEDMIDPILVKVMQSFKNKTDDRKLAAVVRILLKHGANPDNIGQSRISATSYAIRHNLTHTLDAIANYRDEEFRATIPMAPID